MRSRSPRQLRIALGNSLLSAAAGALISCSSPPAVVPTGGAPLDQYTPPRVALSTAPLTSPRSYECHLAPVAPLIDGAGNDPAWEGAPWTDDFTDIEGSSRPAPSQRTRVKMTWDASHFYILAELEETDIWATLTRHDEIVFHDNDFEVFVDPDGDTREYYEIEVNALGTIFDLFLPEPYRTQGASKLPRPGADHDWHAAGLVVAIGIDGTLNDPSDQDSRWRVEMAIPWSTFRPVAQPDGGESFQRASCPPAQGDTWRVNFSRVQWTLEKVGNSYAKVAGKPEDNWVWSPQWIIDMHVPQWWGRVRFAPPAKGEVTK